MAKDRSGDGYVTDPTNGDQTCGQPYEPHFGALLAILMMAGLNFDCRDGYRALVEIAEVVRQVGGFQPFTANTADDSIVKSTVSEIQSALALKASGAVMVPGSKLAN
jgi:hypothetical protein